MINGLRSISSNQKPVLLKENKLSKRLNPVFGDNSITRDLKARNTKLCKGFSTQHKGNIGSRERTNSTAEEAENKNEWLHKCFFWTSVWILRLCLLPLTVWTLMSSDLIWCLPQPLIALREMSESSSTHLCLCSAGVMRRSSWLENKVDHTGQAQAAFIRPRAAAPHTHTHTSKDAKQTNNNHSKRDR